MDSTRIEFHRHAMALLPEEGDARAGVAVLFEGDPGRVERKCSCVRPKGITCQHIKSLSAHYRKLQRGSGEIESARHLRETRIYRALAPLLDHHAVPVTEVEVRVAVGDRPMVYDRHGALLIEFLAGGLSAMRFVDRLKGLAETGVFTRAGVLDDLIRITRTPLEWQMVGQGARTRRQATEESIWYRLAYHLFQEQGAAADILLTPVVEKVSGAFMLHIAHAQGDNIARCVIPSTEVERFLVKLAEVVPDHTCIPLHPIPVQSIFRISATTEVDVVEVEPALRFLSAAGEERFFAREDLTRFRYGDLQYIPEINLMVRLAADRDRDKKFVSPKRMRLAGAQIASFVAEICDATSGPTPIVGLDIIERFDRIEISGAALDREWCWLDVSYGVGDTSVSLSQIIEARERRERFVRTAAGWVDSASMDIERLLDRLGSIDANEPGGHGKAVKLSRMDFIRLSTDLEATVTFNAKSDVGDQLDRLWSWKPAVPLRPLDGLHSTLRDYQTRGVEWLLFLYDNGLGGLLCDDMGLGKTHQAMALMVALREQRNERRPFLVVAPATVVSHWQRLIERFAPGLTAAVHYGAGRDLAEAREADIILTTYGVLRNDVTQLQQIEFAAALFDEAHIAKNRATLTFDAATNIRAGLKLGLSGTPVENSPTELWALMALTMPGYLGPFDAFAKTYASENNGAFDAKRTIALSAKIRPFTLRRLKSSVLSELPPKIEDIRTCRLGDEQVGLYRDAISSRAGGLVEALRDKSKKAPYMHVFALLGLLKQICDHPALVAGGEQGEGRSGKLALLEELLDESLASGHKVVIYSQYLGMIDIIAALLTDKEVPHVTLTGQSRHRGELVERFNEDDHCRVFVGSLLAGGLGIDLTAASVVIHYDRWWNAAKEDQATDRVHRIGQNRSVHVLKLVTEGTLEEKIHALIEKKRAMMDQIIKEDDPALLKSFDPEELVALLAPPE